MTDNLYHLWTPPGADDGFRFGFKPSEDSPHLIFTASGLDDLSTNGGMLGDGGRDGRGIAPLWADARTWTMVADVFGKGLTRSQWFQLLADLNAATVPTNARATEGTYDIHYYDETVKTLFARVTRRSIPTDRALLVDQMTEAEVTFAACDPKKYGPIVEVADLSPGGSTTFTHGGNCSSGRWQVVGHGPLHNPRVTLSVDGYDDQIVRVVHSVLAGQNLNIDVTPFGVTVTVGGPTFNKYGEADGGNTNIPPQFFEIPANVECTIAVGGSGGGDYTVRHRVAEL